MYVSVAGRIDRAANRKSSIIIKVFRNFIEHSFLYTLRLILVINQNGFFLRLSDCVRVGKVVNLHAVTEVHGTERDKFRLNYTGCPCDDSETEYVSTELSRKSLIR